MGSIGSRLAVIAAFAICACQQGTEGTQAAWRARQADWSRTLASLRRQQVDLAVRLRALPAGDRAASGERNAQRLTADAYVSGAQQALADVDMQMAQASSRIESALTGSAGAAAKVFEEESTRMSGYVAALVDQVGSAARQVAAVERGPVAAATPSAGGE